MNSSFSFREWLKWKLSPLINVLYLAYNLFLSFLGWIHRWSGFLLEEQVVWETLWTSVPVCGEVTSVVRIKSTLGLAKKVEGLVIVQRHRGTYRIVLEGFESANGELGGSFYGSLYLPDSVEWTITANKVQGFNTTSVKGVAVLLAFANNPTGITNVQIAIFRNNPRNPNAKLAAAEFQNVMIEAKESTNRMLKADH